MFEMTEEQRKFLVNKYSEAYLSAKAKMKMINELGNDAYNKDGLKPEFTLTMDEKAVLNMPKELFSELDEEKGRSL